MNNITKATIWRRVVLSTLTIFLLSGCITLTEPVEEPSPLEPLLPSATPEEVVQLYQSPTSTPVGFLPTGARMGEEAYFKQIFTPTPSPTPDATATPYPSPTPTREPTIYEVVEGDTLSVIAIKHAISLEALMAANSLSDADTLSIGQQLLIPSASQIVEVEAQRGTPIPTPQTESGHLIHYIQVGETISAIAAQYNVERNDVLMANGLRPDVQLFAGDTLIIPQGPYDAVPTATALPATEVPTVEIALAPSFTPTAAPTFTPAPTETPAPNLYTVKEGDYARLIASAHNITLDQLKAVNPGVELERLSVGQTLVIPPGSPSAERDVTPTAITLAPTATPTPIPPIMGTHVVREGESWLLVAQQYGVTEEVLRGYNEAVTDTLMVDASLQVPLGTATPTPSPTPPPTRTPTPSPAYLAPIPLLPADGSTWMHWEGKAPLQLVWTSTGILSENEFYVVRLRALDSAGEVLWSISHWTQNPSWRLGPDVLDRIDGRVKLRWDVMVMRRTSAPNEEPQSGVALSNKSPTFELIFVRSE